MRIVTATAEGSCPGPATRISIGSSVTTLSGRSRTASPSTAHTRTEAAARRAGFLVNAVQPDAIRLAPPLILTPAEAEEFLTGWPALVDQVEQI